MKIQDTFSDAFSSLKTNAMRSVLTTLGIIIGVGAVIIMVSVGNAAKVQINDMIDKLGANIMMVMPDRHFNRGAAGSAGSLPTLTEDDAWAVRDEISVVKLVAPYVRGTAQLIFGNLNWNSTVQGVTNEYFGAREWNLAAGRLFYPEEIKGASKVAIIGKTVVDNLFPNQDPLGLSIRVNQAPFTIIGILESKGQTGFIGDQDDTLVIPLTTAKKRVLGGRTLSGKLVGGIYVKAKSAEVISETEERVRELLRFRHKITPNKDDDFRIRNMAEMMNARADSSKAMGFLLMAVASISLVVGGIGIMNIMLVSVTERTREIGLRMAIGATGNDIMAQFLVESIVLSLIGGIIGVALGVGGSFAMSAYSQWKTVINYQSVMLAFSFSAAVGVFFGLYPAHKASLLDPIEALRHE